MYAIYDNIYCFSTGLISTLAGSGSSDFADGQGSLASFNTPYGVAVDSMGTVYVTDSSNDRIRLVTSAGEYIYACMPYMTIFIMFLHRPCLYARWIRPWLY